MNKYYYGFVLLTLAASMVFAPPLTGESVAQSPGLPGPSVNTTAPGVPIPSGTDTKAMPPELSPHSTIANVEDSYRLGTGDKLKVTVYGEDDLSGEFTVDGSGQVQLPLVGQIQAANLTVHQFVDAVQKSLGTKYLRNPRVSVEIENYRPFYIMGEVNKPGEYPYENGLNALGAIALAGGFTYRANDSDVYVRRNGESQEKEMPANGTTLIGPGDIVRVPERIF